MGEINVKFRKMNDEEYKRFVEESVLDYSKSLIESGRSSKEKHLMSHKKYLISFLIKGNTQKITSFIGLKIFEKKDVGILWYTKQGESKAFIADFLVFEEYRKKGYGRQTLLLLEKEVKENGLSKIALHVFKFNTIAFSLYSSLGYKVVKEEDTGFIMVKDV